MENNSFSIKRVLSLIAVIVMPFLALVLIFVGVNTFTAGNVKTAGTAGDPSGLGGFFDFILDIIGVGSFVFSLVSIVIFIISLRYLRKRTKSMN